MKFIAIIALALVIAQSAKADDSATSVICYDPYTEAVHVGQVDMKRNCDQVNRVLQSIDNFTCKFSKPGKSKDCEQTSIQVFPEAREINDLLKVMYFHNRNWSMK